MKKRIKGLLIDEKWSPELIAKRLAKDSEQFVSHEIIYKWIWMAKHSNHKDHLEYKKLYKHLRHTGPRQKRNNIKDRRGTIAGRIGIYERPKVVERRFRIGDIEVT
jgi:IS30 family transposase